MYSYHLMMMSLLGIAVPVHIRVEAKIVKMIEQV